jgi:hypothetical protein
VKPLPGSLKVHLRVCLRSRKSWIHVEAKCKVSGRSLELSAILKVVPDKVQRLTFQNISTELDTWQKFLGKRNIIYNTVSEPHSTAHLSLMSEPL